MRYEAGRMSISNLHAARCLGVVFAALASACTIEADKAFTDCHIGSLTGTWKYHYEETSGNCGRVPDYLGTNPGTAPITNCTDQTTTPSDDKCTVGLIYTCPTTDGLGSQGWSLHLRQTAADELTGGGTLQITHPTGACQSSYNLTIQKQ